MIRCGRCRRRMGPADPTRPVTVWLSCALVVLGLGWLSGPRSVMAIETADPVAMTTTVLVLALDTTGALPVRATFNASPPTIAIEFPGQRVAGSLPERSVIEHGAVQEIITQYAQAPRLRAAGRISSLRIVLSAPYAYRVRSEPGHVIVEIKHPVTVSSAALEIGLQGGTIRGRSLAPEINGRFHAMQAALARMTPTPWTLQVTPGFEELATPQRLDTHIGTPAGSLTLRQPSVQSPSSVILAMQPQRSHKTAAGIVWVTLGILAISSAVILWSPVRAQVARALLPRIASSKSGVSIPASAMLVDQLVWRSFERQGYQLVTECALTQPFTGLLRIILKDNTRAALFFVGNGPFFEKQTVGRFLQAMRQVKVEQGFLVAAGSFTVPAQRMAKEHRITLIGREQLVELLSAGASSEYVMKQLEQQQAQMEEAKTTLQQYAQELDTLRRQRNEASWYLGEERAHSATLEVQLEELGGQLRRHAGELARWEQEVVTLRKQWEESQWYLGESQARVRYFETQVSALQALAKRVESAERARDEAHGALGEERAARQTLEAQAAELQGRLEAFTEREQALQQALERLTQEMSVLQAHGERRSHLRVSLSGVSVALYNGAPEPLSAGLLRDLSRDGIGLSTASELPSVASVRIQLHLANGKMITGHGRLIWQQSEQEPGRYRSGAQWTELPMAARARLNQLIGAQS